MYIFMETRARALFSFESIISLKYQDTTKRYNISNDSEIINYVIDNFLLVEVKTSTGRNARRRTKAQIKLKYEDVLIKLLLHKTYDNGFIGELTELNYFELLGSLNIDYNKDELNLLFTLNESKSVVILEKIIHKCLGN